MHSHLPSVVARALEVNTKVANAFLGVVSAAALASELASQDASISELQASKAGASDTSLEVDLKIAAALLGAVTTAALPVGALAALFSTVDGLDTPLEVKTKIANALLGLATEAFVTAQLASRDASISALQGDKAALSLVFSPARLGAIACTKQEMK